VTRCSCLLSELEVLGSLVAQLLLGLTFLTFKTKDDLTCGLGLLVEDGLGLSSETHLLRVVTSLSLGEVGSLSGLVLGDLVQGVLLALSCTVGSAFFGNIHHDVISLICSKNNNNPRVKNRAKETSLSETGSK
jgi:hypothetical protein